MVNISKSDWKLFQERLPDWQENYMERLLKEYAKIIKSSEKPSERFWKLEKRINEDSKSPGVIIRIEKSETIWNIAKLLRLGVITEDDLEGFSPELIDAVKQYLSF
ncbi:MAG: hypothetical protein IKP88_15255 [Lachnospiraceae bacterium]|nr:hypothetical protein [Lachnospiraceae bacterium]